jgi:hypothetical protein
MGLRSGLLKVNTPWRIGFSSVDADTKRAEHGKKSFNET